MKLTSFQGERTFRRVKPARPKTGKPSRFLAMLLTLMMLLTFLPAFALSALAAPPSSADFTGNVFVDLGFDENAVDRDAEEDNLPYRDNSPLKSVRELYIGGAGNPFTFGTNGQLGVYPAPANGYNVTNLPGGASFVLPSSFTLDGSIRSNAKLGDIYKVYEGDFDGDGRKNELAVVCQVTHSGANLLLLCVVPAENNTVPLVPISVLSSGSVGESDVICADVTGDGVDEIITAAYGDSSLKTYCLKPGSKGTDNWKTAENWQSPVVTPFGPTWSHSGAGYTFPISDLTIGRPEVAFSMAAGDIDRDGCEDIVYIASSLHNGSRNGVYRSAYVLYGKRYAATPEYTQQQMLFDKIQGMPEGKGDKDSDGSRAFGRFGVTVCDMDGDANPEILVAFIEANELYYTSNYGKYNGRKYDVVRLNYTSRTTEFAAEHVYRSREIKRTGSGSEKDLPCDDPEFSSPLCIARLDNDYGRHSAYDVWPKNPYAWGSVIVNGDINAYAITYNQENGQREYNNVVTGFVPCVMGYKNLEVPSASLFFSTSEQLASTGEYCVHSIDNNIRFQSIRQTTINGSGDGFVVQYYNYHENKTHIKYYDSSTYSYFSFMDFQGPCSEFLPGSNNTGLSRYKKGDGAGMYFALPDLDHDSVYLKYKDHNFFWSDPRIVAALASSPYFAGLSSDNYTYGSTSYGTSKEFSGSTVKSNSNSVGAYVSAEFEFGGPFVKGIIETEIGYNHTWTHSTEQTETIAFTSGFSTPGGEDTVVLATSGFDVYNYMLYTPTGENPDGSAVTGQLYTVVVPRGKGTQDMQISYDMYEQIRSADEHGILPDLSGVFSHTLGDPNSYPKGVPTGGFVKDNSAMSYADGATFPNNNSTKYLGTAISTGSSESWTEANSIDAKLGAGIKIGDDKTPNFTIKAGVTYGHEWERGKTVANTNGVYFEGAVAGQGSQLNSGFNWQLLTYTYTNNPGMDPDIETREFPVVTYVVSNVRYEKGHTPGEVIVGVQDPDPVEVAVSGRKNITYKVLAPGIDKATPITLNHAPVGVELVTTVISNPEQFITLSIDSNVRGGSYPLTITIDNVESNTFYLNVDSGPKKVTVATKDGSKSLPAKEYRTGQLVSIDVSEWKGESQYFSWANDYSSVITGFDLSSPVLTFVMPDRDLDFVADFHDHADTIARIKAVKSESYDESSILAAPNITQAKTPDTVLLWADFGNGRDGTEYRPADNDADYKAEVYWNVFGADSPQTKITDSGRVAGSPIASLLIGSDEEASSITVRATSKKNPDEFKEYTLDLIIPPRMISTTPDYIEFPEVVAGLSSPIDIRELTIKNLNTGNLRPSLRITDIRIAGEDAGRFRLEGAGDIIGHSIAGNDTAVFGVTRLPVFFPSDAGDHNAYVVIEAEEPDNPGEYNNTLFIPLFHHVLAPPPREMTVTPDLHEYPAADHGYDEQPTQMFTIFTRAYDDPPPDPTIVPITGLEISLSGADFEISTPLDKSVLPPIFFENTATFGVRPKTGLSGGLHTDTITIESDNGVPLSVNISFFVEGGSTVTGVTVSPATVDVPKGGSRNFTATVEGTGSPSQLVTWTVEGGGQGTSIDSGGRLTVAASETAATLTVRATSAADPSQSGTATVTLTDTSAPPNITTASLPDGTVGAAYSQTLEATGDTPITWSLDGGSLPDGLTLSDGGVISGTPTAAGTFTFTVKAVNGVSPDAAKVLSITIGSGSQTPEVLSVTVTPNTVSVQKGQTQKFLVDVITQGGASQDVTWSVNSTLSSIDVNGNLTVAANETATTLIVTATSVFDNSAKGTATVNVVSGPPTPAVLSVTVTPDTVSVQKGQAQKFLAAVLTQGSASQNVTWSVSSTVGSTIDDSGILIVAAHETASVLIVTATSVADGTKKDSAAVNVINNPSEPKVIKISVTPETVDVRKGKSQKFSADVIVQGSASQNVTWSVNSTLSHIDDNGILTVAAHETATTLVVTATSVFDNTVKGAAAVNITVPTSPPVIMTAALPNGAVGSFYNQMLAAGGDAPVTWSLDSGSLPNGLTLSRSGVISGTPVVKGTYGFSVRASNGAGHDSKHFLITVDATLPITYPVTVLSAGTGATGSGGYAAGATVNIGAGTPPAGIRFKNWTASPGVVLADADSANTSFQMTAYAVTVKAEFEAIPPTVTGVTVNPSTATVRKGETFTFSATVTGQNNPDQRVTWAVTGGIPGTVITANGRLTVDAAETAATLTVTATSALDGSKSDSATVAVSNAAPPTPTVTGVTVHPAAVTLNKGDTYTFSAAVTGLNNPDQSVDWLVTGGGAGTSITSHGTLTVAADESAGTLTVSATSNLDGTQFGTATVTVLQAVAPTYTVTVNGSYAAQSGAGRYTAGETVSISAGSRSGYSFTGWTSSDGVIFANASSAATTFIMPAKTVSVTAAWSSVSGGDSPTANPTETLPDTKPPLADPDSPFITDHIQYIYGYPDGSIDPDNPVTRAEMCALLFRLLTDEDKNKTQDAVFPDVKKDAWYFQEVTYLADIGIVSGYPSGQFKPDAPMTRAEFTALISRFFELEPGDITSFPDIAGHWAVEDINSAAGKGWVTGFPDGTFRPENNLTRAEAVTIINRMLNRGIDKADLPDWTPKYNDLSSTHWAYADILEASVGHQYERKDDGKEIWTEKLPETPTETRGSDITVVDAYIDDSAKKAFARSYVRATKDSEPDNIG